MTTDQMRDGFETWADAKGLTLTRIKWKDGTTSEYAYTATCEAWQVWQDAYAAGQKAEGEAIVKRIRNVDGNLAWQSRIAFEALANLIATGNGDDER